MIGQNSLIHVVFNDRNGLDIIPLDTVCDGNNYQIVPNEAIAMSLPTGVLPL